jgi:hypothetical protein
MADFPLIFLILLALIPGLLLLALAYGIARQLEYGRSRKLREYFQSTVSGGRSKLQIGDHTCYLQVQRLGCFLVIDLPCPIGKFQVLSDATLDLLTPKVGRCCIRPVINGKALNIYASSQRVIEQVGAHPKTESLLTLLFSSAGLRGISLMVGQQWGLFNSCPRIIYLHGSFMFYQHPQLLEAVVLDLLDVFEERSF